MSMSVIAWLRKLPRLLSQLGFPAVGSFPVLSVIRDQGDIADHIPSQLVCGGIVLLNMMRQNFHWPSACLLKIQRFFRLIVSTPPPAVGVRAAVTVARANPQCPAASTSS